MTKNMKLSTSQIKIMQDDLSIEIVQILMDEWHYSMMEAMNLFYNSDTFELLSNPSTGLYYQSAGYVFDFLKKEIQTGVCH